MPHYTNYVSITLYYVKDDRLYRFSLILLYFEVGITSTAVADNYDLSVPFLRSHALIDLIRNSKDYEIHSCLRRSHVIFLAIGYAIPIHFIEFRSINVSKTI